MIFLRAKLVFLFVFLLIIFFLGYQFFVIAGQYKEDYSMYVTLIQGMGYVQRGQEQMVLPLQKKMKLFVGDIVVTIKEESRAVIEWGDKSVTRLGGNTKVQIKEHDIETLQGNIRIYFVLLKGRTWNYVVSFLKKESYFKEEVKGITAAARGTVFEADYDKGFFAVYEHAIDILDDTVQNEVFHVKMGQFFSLEKRKAVDEFLRYVDKQWILWNRKMDALHLKKIQEEFIQKFLHINVMKRIYLTCIGFFKKEVYFLMEWLHTADTRMFTQKIQEIPLGEKEQIVSKMFLLLQPMYQIDREGSDFQTLSLKTRSFFMDIFNNETDKYHIIKNTWDDLYGMIQEGEYGASLKNMVVFLKQYHAFMDEASFDMAQDMKESMRIFFQSSLEQLDNEYLYKLFMMWKDSFQKHAKNSKNILLERYYEQK